LRTLKHIVRQIDLRLPRRKRLHAYSTHCTVQNLYVSRQATFVTQTYVQFLYI